MKPALVILAAGLASRYGADKQLAGVGPGGEPILVFTALDAAAAGFGELVLVVRPGQEAVVSQVVGDRLRRILPLRYAVQADPEAAGRRRPWGTAHALACALSGMQTPCGVANADDWYGPPALAALAAWLRDPGAAVGMVAFRIGRTLSRHGTVNRGLATASGGQLTGLVEVEGLRPAEGGATAADGSMYPDATLASMNLWGLRPEAHPAFTSRVAKALAAHRGDQAWECQLPTVIMDGLRAGCWQADCRATDADWCGLTYAADRPEVQARLGDAVAAGLYPGLGCLAAGGAA